MENRDDREGMDLRTSWRRFVLNRAPQLADHLSLHGFRISRNKWWRHRSVEYFVWDGGRVIAVFEGVLSVWTVTYGDVNPQLTSIASQYGNVSSVERPFDGDATGPDVTGKAVVERTFRIVLAVVFIVLALALSEWFGLDARTNRSKHELTDREGLAVTTGRSGQPQLQR
jgi:hypothetical protein